MEKYPFFVYGTLMLGQPNERLWEDCIERTAGAYFPNGRLYDMGSFPMLIEGGQKKVAGQLMHPYKVLSDEAYQLLVQRLDTLENYDPDNIETSPYYRVLKTVFEDDAQPVVAWIYLGRPSYAIGRPIIDSGDWVGYSADVHSHIAAWWEEHGQDLLFGETRNKADRKD